jgi:hypothetical protein
MTKAGPKGPGKRRSLMGRFFSRFTIGFAVGYVVGARAGRERYEQLRGWWNSFARNPTVHQAADKGREFVSDAGRSLVGELRSRTGGQTAGRHQRESAEPLAGS